MKTWIMKTAWPMTTPLPYSPFHICISLMGALFSILAARALSRRVQPKTACTVLFCCGALLTTCEIYKQLFLYYVVNGGVYDWWYFPFQLCSLPMYFCLLLPLVRSGRVRLVLCTFMQDFHLLGGVMALAEPSGLLHPYWTLTLHGLFWHIILIFLSFFIGFCGLSDLSLKGFFRTIPLFGACCLAASLINVCTLPRGQADMFYISPYYPSNQIVYHQISLKTGIFIGNLIYLFSICLGGLLCHLLFMRIMRRRGGTIIPALTQKK